MFYFEVTFCLINNEHKEQCRMVQVDCCGLDHDDFTMCSVWQTAIDQATKLLDNDKVVNSSEWEISKIEFLGC